jgi:ABC-2 type transport system ATP-binding protein
MPIIEADKLTKRFGEVTALEQLSLSVEVGEVFGLVGPDGAGKTTTMRLLAGIMDPTEGWASVAGLRLPQDAEAVKELIGYMSQRFSLYPDLTVDENLAFYADIYGVPRRGRAEKAEKLLAFSHLLQFRQRYAGHLSGGMKQKLALACALIHTPKVLLLDEPTNGVDPVSRRDFWRLLYRLLREGVTIFVSTAYLDEAERCNRIALLNKGRLLALGTPEEVKKLMRGRILEVRCPQPRLVRVALRKAMPEATVGLFGDGVHVVVEETERRSDGETKGGSDETAERRSGGATEMKADEQSVRNAVEAEGLAVESIREIEPSLEDVFVSAVGDRR